MGYLTKGSHFFPDLIDVILIDLPGDHGIGVVAGLLMAQSSPKPPDDAALAFFRITQEALHNAMQHADASEIAVRLTQYPDRMRLTVTDDGQGIAGGVAPARFVAQGHYGLAGMRERAAMIGAKLDVQTAPDYGTVVVLELPS